jgi:hypothetical protein
MLRPSDRDTRSINLDVAAPIIILLLFAALALWQIFAPESMHWWADEDSIFEYGTALLYGACSYIFIQMARKGSFPAQSFRLLGRAILVFGAVACFVVMGEEVSWGQRIIGFDTPEAWAEKNYQQETTLHNLDWVYENLTSSETGVFKANFFNLAMIGAGLGLPILALIPWIRRLTARLAIPIFPLRYCMLFVGGWAYGKFLQDYAVHFNDPPEVREFMYAAGVLLFALTGLLRPWEVYRVKPEDMSDAEENKRAGTSDLGLSTG